MNKLKLFGLASACGQRERILLEKATEELRKKLDGLKTSNAGIIWSDLKCSPEAIRIEAIATANSNIHSIYIPEIL